MSGKVSVAVAQERDPPVVLVPVALAERAAARLRDDADYGNIFAPVQGKETDCEIAK